MTRPINPKKLMHSKWTAVAPVNREKHFMVVELIKDEVEIIQECILEAVINKKQYTIAWQELKKQDKWQQGWR